MQEKLLRFGEGLSVLPISPLRVSMRQLCTLGVLIMALIITNGCSSSAEKPAPPPPGVTVTPAIQRDVPIHQEWVGTMAGNVDADIRPKVEGFLLSRLYTEGSYITKGTPMFQLDKRQAQAAVEQADEGCPFSQLLKRAGATVTVTARLA